MRTKSKSLKFVSKRVRVPRQFTKTPPIKRFMCQSGKSITNKPFIRSISYSLSSWVIPFKKGEIITSINPSYISLTLPEKVFFSSLTP